MDWTQIDRGIAEMYHLTPQIVDQMTLAEIAVLLMTRKKGVLSDADVLDYGARWKLMTPRQRLESKRHG